VVQVRLTDEGRAMLARRRAVRAERLAVILARLSPDEQAALSAALPPWTRWPTPITLTIPPGAGAVSRPTRCR